MANILYRSGAAGATTFNVASTNGSVARPLTNAEIDGNFYALDQGPTVGTTQLKPNVTYSTLSGLTSVTATTFNGSLNGNAGTVTTNANLTGDVTSVGNATTLATVNTNVGTFNSVTVNAKGLVTAASNVNTVTAAFQFSDTTQSTSSSTGGVTMLGGLGVAKSIYAGLTISAVGNITSTSDSRVKTNLQRITSALSKVNQLNGYTFDRTDIETSRQTGVIAQEVLLVLPEAVTGTKDAYSVAYGNMMGLMIEAIKELNAKVTDLQNQLTINK